MPSETAAAPTDRLRAGPWLAGALVAAFLHAGAVAALLVRPTSELLEDDSGANAIEIGVELASPRPEQVELPPGPDSDSAAASVASARQTSEPERPEAPEEKPVEEPEPERVVAPEPPKEAEPEKVEERSEASTESAAAEATAAPRIEVPKEAPVPVAPTPGAGAGISPVKATWQRQLVAHLNKSKRYPAGGTRRDVKVLVRFTMDRTGRLQSATIVQGSGDAQFDEAALAMLRRADPLPMPPAIVADDGLSFSLPVIFTANAKP